MKKAIVVGVLAFCLTAAAAYAKTMSVAKDNVNVREKPSLKAKVLFKAPLAYPIEVKEEKNNWVFFEDWQGNKGWIHKKLVSPVSTTVVQVDTANVRKGPGTSKPLVNHVKRGEIYKVFDETGDWVKIGYYFENEVVGWVHEDLVWGY